LLENFILSNKFLMMFILLRKAIAFFLVYLVYSIQFVCADTTEFDELRQRVINDALYEKGFLPRVSRYINPDFDKADSYLSEMNSDGSWESVDYGDTDNNWAPLQALDKILVMAHAYSHPDNPLYRNKELLAGTSKALNYWYQVAPTCVNWYKNDIAKQMYLGVIAILLQGHINEDLIRKMIEDQTAEPRMTGSNRTLVSISVFYRGLLERNAQRIAAGVKGVMAQVEVSKKEGVQIDYSFHQHGPYLYNGNYGSNFLRETIWLAAMVEGSEFAFTDDRMKVLRGYYFEGTRWMIRGQLMDYNIRGRQVGRPEGGDLRGDVLLPQLNYFIKADPVNAAAYQRSRDLVKNNKPQEIEGNKHYWRSDYTVHHKVGYFTSLRMCSERTVGVETHVNFENLLGRNIPYGMTYIYRRGDEYKDIFSVWDWAKLPGVTCSYEVPSEKGKYTQQVDFVGGVSDGKYGISTMQLDLRDTQAKKSWFWFDGEWVALGADINSSNSNAVVTGINQTNLNGIVLVDGKEHTSKDKIVGQPSWVWHDSIAYIFPNTPKNMHLEAQEKSGNMKRIYGLGSDAPIKKEVFTLWFDHGLKPKNEKYEYIVVPGIGKNDLDKYATDIPIKVLSNTSKVQAVFNSKAGITGIVFHEPGTFQLNESLHIEVSKPILLLVDHRKKQLTVSDPTTKLKDLEINLIANGYDNELVKFNLPQGLNAGKSFDLGFKLDQLGIKKSNQR
jgi:chondroitin AC lyase